MKLKKITIQKSRTICVDQLLGRDKYRKLVIGLEVEPQTPDEKDNLQLCYQTLSDELDALMQLEIKKINKSIKKK